MELGYESRGFRKSFSPQGDLLVGRQKTRTQCHLLEMDPASGMPLGEPVSDFPEFSSCSSWSSEGARLQYYDWIVSQASPDPVVVERDIETGGERLITSPTADEQAGIDWQIPRSPQNVPDYRWRFFSKPREKFIYRYDLETEQAEIFHEAAGRVLRVGVSPNADYLYFQTLRPGPAHFLSCGSCGSRTSMSGGWLPRAWRQL